MLKEARNRFNIATGLLSFKILTGVSLNITVF